MADLENIKREHVLKAIEEYDAVGADAFVETYGFDGASRHVLVHGARQYGTEPIVGVANRFVTGQPLTGEELAADSDGPARILRGLGFEVEGPDLPRLPYTNAATVGNEHARATWALAARELLVETAGRYHATATAQELADFVQRRSLIRTTQLPSSWLGDVLRRVSADCAGRREPLLSSLCVDSHGRVTAAYATAVAEFRGEEVADPDQHAAVERLECYRHFGAVLPPGGGEPAMPAPVATRAARSSTRSPGRSTDRSTGRSTAPSHGAPRPATKRARKAPSPAVVAAEKPLVTCPVHFQVLPASGVCDLCE
jgi:hypothetical protein